MGDDFFPPGRDRRRRRVGRMISIVMRLFGRRSCADAAAVLDGYYEGSLDPQLDGIIERHLQRCADCAPLARTYRETAELTEEAHAVAARGLRPALRRALQGFLQQPGPQVPGE